MAELATIARPYAEALYKALAGDSSAQTQAQSWLGTLATIVQNETVLQFAANPKTEAAHLTDALTSVVQQATGQALPSAGNHFLQLLVKNGRLNVLPEIAKQFNALMSAQSGVFDAMVHSAFPLNEAQLADLAITLEKRFGRKLKLNVTLAPELLGGIKVVVGDEVLDTSVKARLEQMRTALVA